MQPRPILVSVLLIASTIAAGLTIRLVHLGLPTIVTKYGGSVLWALMIYWIVSTLEPRWTPVLCAMASSGIEVGVEFFKLVRTPPLDAFRLTLPGQLLLGQFFSGWGLLAYAVGVYVGAWADRLLRGPVYARATEIPCQRRSWVF